MRGKPAPRDIHRSGRRRKRAAAAFTLTELMIALGILGIGLTMVAAALHAGIQTHDRTMDDLLRSMIADNALAIARARLTHGATPPDVGDSLAMPRKEIGLEDRKFPVGQPSGRGYIVFARHLTGADNLYEFMILPYTVGNPDNYVDANPLLGYTILDAGTVSKVMLFFPDDYSQLPIGGIVMDNRSGKYGTIAAHQSPWYAVLDRKLSVGATDLSSLVVLGPGGTVDQDDTPHFMEAFSVRTALPPAP